MTEAEAVPLATTVSAARSTDAELVAAIAAGDRGALETVYDQHSPAVHALASRLCGRADAAGIIEAVFIDLWSRAPYLEPDQMSLGRYLHRQTHRWAVHHLRRACAGRANDLADLFRRRPESAVAVDDHAPRHPDGDTASDRLEVLPQGERDAISLAYFGGYTCAQIAALVGEPQATITQRIRSGLIRLSDESSRSEPPRSIGVAASPDQSARVSP